jgi:hypothetical protein
VQALATHHAIAHATTTQVVRAHVPAKLILPTNRCSNISDLKYGAVSATM